MRQWMPGDGQAIGERDVKRSHQPTHRTEGGVSQ